MNYSFDSDILYPHANNIAGPIDVKALRKLSFRVEKGLPNATMREAISLRFNHKGEYCDINITRKDLEVMMSLLENEPTEISKSISFGKLPDDVKQKFIEEKLQEYEEKQ